MKIIEAIILGIVQGLTEFLPVSSSGHLVLLQKVFNINLPSLFFDTMLHAGTLLAVFVVLWKNIWELLKRPVQKLTGLLIIATIPAVIAALLFNDTIEEVFKSANILGWCFLVTTVILVTSELLSRKAKNEGSLKTSDKMTWLDAVVIGIMQAVAILPGISRSGSTISGALFRKLDRDFAARFSFLLSIPAILGALVLQIKELIKGESVNAVSPTADLSSQIPEAGLEPLSVIFGTLTAAIVGFFAVKFMLKIIRERSLFGFAIYTGVLGILIIIDQFLTKIVF